MSTAHGQNLLPLHGAWAPSGGTSAAKRTASVPWQRWGRPVLFPWLGVGLLREALGPNTPTPSSLRSLPGRWSPWARVTPQGPLLLCPTTCPMPSLSIRPLTLASLFTNSQTKGRNTLNKPEAALEGEEKPVACGGCGWHVEGVGGGGQWVDNGMQHWDSVGGMGSSFSPV